MADEKTPLNQLKKPDRLKPFKRINNDDFKPSDPPDGLGVACGCHTPDDLPNLEEEFKKFLEDPNNSGALGNVLTVLKDARDAAHKVVQVADIVSDAMKGIIAAAAALGVLGGGIGALVATLAAAAAAVKAISNFIDNFFKLIDDAVKEFFARIGATLARRAIRHIPQWVPVLKGASSQTITKDQIKEVEGIVVRSYGDPIETPFFQWHDWLNWSFQVQPEKGYENLLPKGFALNTVNQQSGETPIVAPGTFEVQWDAGALLAADGNGPFDAGFKDTQMPDNDGPMTTGDTRESDWIWPMTGMFAWASGRWVYDCARTDKLTGSNPKMITMINPPRAIATAVWEARQFPENISGQATGDISNRVPAIRFMFLASTHGGYMRYDSKGDDDYEFILDLPPIDQPVTPFPIGHTFAHKRDPGEPPDFPHNTIVIRPRLLRELVPLNGPVGDGALIKPVIEVLPPPSGKPGAAPQQVRITIRASDLKAVKRDYAGFILSLGWLDPTLTQAVTVKNCNVAFSALQGRLSVDRDSPLDQIRPLFQKDLNAAKKTIKDNVDNIPILPNPIPGQKNASINDLINNNLPNFPPLFLQSNVAALGRKLKSLVDDAIDKAFDTILNELGKVISSSQTEEWLVRIGVNGRWQTRFLPDLDKSVQVFKNPITFQVPLGPDDFLFYSSGGVEFNPVGDMMLAPRLNRVLRNAKGTPEKWDEIVNAKGDDFRNLVFDYAIKILTGNSATGLLALGIENAVLGIKDPKSFAGAGNDPAIDDPIAMKGVQDGSNQIQPVVKFARAALPQPSDDNPPQGSGEEFILVEDPSKSDYKLTGLIQIASQKPQQ